MESIPWESEKCGLYRQAVFMQVVVGAGLNVASIMEHKISVLSQHFLFKVIVTCTCTIGMILASI